MIMVKAPSFGAFNYVKGFDNKIIKQIYQNKGTIFCNKASLTTIYCAATINERRNMKQEIIIIYKWYMHENAFRRSHESHKEKRNRSDI